MKRIAVLGATGSIGRQTLDIIGRNPGRYKATVLTAGSRVDDLIAAAIIYRPRIAIIAREDLLPRLRSALSPLGIQAAAGAEALAECAQAEDVDMVVTATVGYSGLEPTIRAIRAGKDIALANKETLVVAGDLISKLLATSRSRIFPVDSEHSAIAQCLAGEDIASVERLIITASGGPFRTWTAADIAGAKAADALRHPNWSMGAKITIDSATMLNKAFEIIEAHHLFGLPAEKISAVVHPQSIVHSMVEFADGGIKAQMGVPDMH
ncbi:MAG: 1-deoxy-D-xylulose-5-phosphate reductoisomerase, partial [Muribaculaceae bacterium]|nr:1-deoxy-D-xylulose-5-phosphate reductoisomerase [Muribaculaceae bacterium]